MTFDSTVLYVLAVLAVAGVVKGVIGMGLPAISMGLLAVVMPPGTAANILLPSLILTNVWQMLAGPHFLQLLHRLRFFLLFVVVGTLAGTGWIAGEIGRIGAGVLGATLALYGVLSLMDFKITVAPAREGRVGAVLGLIAGLINALTAVFSIPAVPFLRAIGLEKDELVQALGIAFTVAAVALGVNLGLASALDPAQGPVSLAGLGAASAGMVIGQRIRAKLDPETFRRWFFIGLTALGLYLAKRGLF